MQDDLLERAARAIAESKKLVDEVTEIRWQVGQRDASLKYQRELLGRASRGSGNLTTPASTNRSEASGDTSSSRSL